MALRSPLKIPNLWSKLLSPRVTETFPPNQQLRPLFTSPLLYRFKTVKRTKRHPFFWLQDKYRTYKPEDLTPSNEEFYQQFLKDKYSLDQGNTPLRTEPWSSDAIYTPDSRRTGLIAKKLGTFVMWDKKGKKITSTCLMIPDNHVIKYHTPEEFSENARPMFKKKYPGLGCMIVGAESKDPRHFTAEYNGLFTESGLMPKKKLTRFMVTHDSRIEPGTPLLASHFRPGMYVDVYGKSIDHGYVSLRMRFKLKLGCASHGNTKNHNRIGSIGRGRKHAGPLKGKKMPGPKGGNLVYVSGLQVWRINTKQNLIWVNGSGVPGEVGGYVNMVDCKITEKRVSEYGKDVPFPTVSSDDNEKLDLDLWHDDIHKPDEPSIIFKISEEEKRAAALAARRFGKAKTAQKLR